MPTSRNGKGGHRIRKGIRVNEDSRVVAERGPFEMVPHWLLYDTTVPALAVRLYLVLRQHASNDALCFPSRGRLCALLGVSLRTLDKARDELISCGALCVSQRRGPRQEWLSTLYHVHWDRVTECEWANEDSLLALVQKAHDPSAEIALPLVQILHDPSAESALLTNTHRTNTSSKNSCVPAEHDNVPGAQTELDSLLEQQRARKPPNGLEHEPPKRARRSARKSGRLAYSADFERFWAAYPRKVGKKAAHEAFLTACEEVPADEIVTAAQRYADDVNREDAYTAHPTTWLRRGGWDDDPLPARNSSKKTGGQARVDNYKAIYDSINKNATKGAIEQ